MKLASGWSFLISLATVVCPVSLARVECTFTCNSGVWLFFGGQEHSRSSRHSSRLTTEFAAAADVARSTISRSGDTAGDRLHSVCWSRPMTGGDSRSRSTIIMNGTTRLSHGSSTTASRQLFKTCFTRRQLSSSTIQLGGVTHTIRCVVAGFRLPTMGYRISGRCWSTGSGLTL